MDSGADSDHLPIFLEIQKNPRKPANPFKLYYACLKNEEVLQIIQNNWQPFQAAEGSRATVHFAQNMFLIKNLLKYWARNKKVMDDQEITQIEVDLGEIRNSYGGDSLPRKTRRDCTL